VTGSAYLSYEATLRVLQNEPDAYVDIKAMQILRAFGEFQIRHYLTKKTLKRLEPDLVIRGGHGRLKKP